MKLKELSSSFLKNATGESTKVKSINVIRALQLLTGIKRANWTEEKVTQLLNDRILNNKVALSLPRPTLDW